MKPLGNRNNITGSKAASQDERFPAALHPGYFKVDERSPGDLLAFITRYSRLITYYNSQGRPDGDWTPFFEQDPVVVLYLVRAYDTAQVRKSYAAKFKLLNQSSDPDFRQHVLWDVLREMIPVLMDADNYFITVRNLTGFHRYFSELITHRLSKVLQVFMQVEEFLVPLENGGKRLYNFLNTFSHEWFAYETAEAEMSPASRQEALDILIRKADEQMHNLLYSLGELKKEAAHYLEKNIDGIGGIQPHVGLLLTFFDLLGKAQEHINSITGRHLDYYYRELLQTSPLPAVIGQTHVVFSLADNMPSQEMPAGTLLHAGNGKNGEELIYELVNPLIVNAAKIESIIGIECNHNVTEQSLLFDQKVLSRQYFQAGPGTLPAMPKAVLTASAGFGFALSDEMLMQAEGERKFSLRLFFTHDSFLDFLAALREEIRLRDEAGETPPEEQDEPAKINGLLRDMFTAACTSAEGWYTIGTGKTDLLYTPGAGPSLRFDVLLESAEPAISAATDPQYPEAVAKELPVLRFLLRDEDSVAYTIFRHLELTETDIDVEVIGIRQLQLRNDAGPVAAGAPFDLFGSQPLPGAGFYIGHPALLCPLYDLRITFEWMGHNALDNGFAAHYKGYDFIRDNTTFKISASTLHARRWLPREDKPVFDLFQDVPEGMGKAGAVSRITRLNNFDLKALQLEKKRSAVPGTGPFPEADLAGFMKLELSFPPNGFGHTEYPGLVNKATQEMARNKRKIIPMPCEPYAPSVKNVLLDFKAKRRVNFSGGDSIFYRHYPFGIEAAEKTDLPAVSRLVPWYPDGSTLMIGLNGIGAHDTLSLLVKINDVVSSITENYPEVKWSVLQGKNWTAIPSSSMLADETSGIKRTGITAFSFSEFTGSESSLFNNRLWWIRLESTKGIPFIALLENIHTQAAKAALHRGEPSGDYLPPGSIKSLVSNNAAIAAVAQPYASHGDRKAESHADWHVRVSERLRHRARALSVWDYERMVLRFFPEVQMVKCISHTNTASKLAPGEIMLAVLPAIEGVGDLSRKGRFTQEKLDEIAESLRTVAPTPVKINVVNPRYEKIKVKLRIKFREGYDENFYIRKANQDICGFLDPWKEGSGLQVKFGAPVNGFAILHFIEHLEYVDFVTNFNVFHLLEGRVINLGSLSSGTSEVIPTSPVSVLVSDHEHIITLHDENSSDSGGINDMMIGTDFIMNAGMGTETGSGINFSRVGRDLEVSGRENPPPAISSSFIQLKINI
ncbi:MAG: hypothetical protein FD123_4106 [Bacteroidetes bacterium]|nr:MAG: hypothetical protein FD123_4106 [Bacteroidota bacterium]